MRGGYGMSTGVNMDKFVSIHIHKCGGTTFGFILNDMYEDKFFWDKSEDPTRTHGRIKHYNSAHVAKADVVHGHIHVDKYSFLKRPYITWLRHPVARLESEYSIIKQKRISGTSMPLHRDVVLKGLDFQGYCEKMRNVFQNYIGDMKVENFAFIGIAEYYEESLFTFSQLIKKKIPPYYRRNTRIMKRQWFKEGTSQEKNMCSQLNRKDIRFYEMARRRLANEFKSCISLYESGECAPQRKR
jgi:hypothetical protein